MQAIVIESPGGPEVLRLGSVPDPVVDPDEVLVRVRAVGVNRADVLQRMGRYPPPPGASPVLGLELAGEVLECGSDAGDWKRGDRVMALVEGGAYAERAAVPHGQLLRVPEGWDWAEAAAVPEAFLTSWLNLVDLGRLQAGQTVLVHAGASGVGSGAIQLARELGATVLATAGTEAKLALCRDLGAATAIDRKAGPFADAVRQATGGAGVDLVLDFVGAPYWNDNLAALRRGGRLVLIGFLGGSRGEIDLGPVLRKSLTVTGTTLRAQPRERKASLVHALGEFALPRFADGRLRPLVDRVFPLAEAADAHRRMEADANAGKIVLTP